MKTSIFSMSVLCSILFLFSDSVLGQNDAKPATRSFISQAATGAGKVTVIVVGSAAKIAWGTTKFAAKNAALPLAKSVVKLILFEVIPRITVIALKLAGKTVNKAVPVATKFGYAYLKTKLPV